jgi:tRNA pseudouridine(38-40) synthase
MRQYVLVVAYDGTRFSGFQRQHSQLSATSSGNLMDARIQTTKTKDFLGTVKKRPRFDSTTGRRLAFDHNKKVTIQECLEHAILHWISSSSSAATSNDGDDDNSNKRPWTLDDLKFRFAGRTDKGVHARGQVVTMELPLMAIMTNIDTGSKNLQNQDKALCNLQKAMNSRLPVDISISAVFQSPLGKEIDARHDAKLKQYSYTIKFQKTIQMPATTEVPLFEGGPQSFRHALDDSSCLWLCPWALDLKNLQSICQKLHGAHDYSSFVHKEDRSQKDNTLTVTRLDFEILQEIKQQCYDQTILLQPKDESHDGNHSNHQEDTTTSPVVIVGRFVVEAKGFRRTMVRNLVGFAVDVARGVQSQEKKDMEEIWNGSPEAAARVNAAPACGLCLEFVRY